VRGGRGADRSWDAGVATVIGKVGATHTPGSRPTTVASGAATACELCTRVRLRAELTHTEAVARRRIRDDAASVVTVVANASATDSADAAIVLRLSGSPKREQHKNGASRYAQQGAPQVVRCAGLHHSRVRRPFPLHRAALACAHAGAVGDA